MPLYTADALVLRTYKLGEADRIVVFLTADRGKKRGVAKSARRPKSRFVGALEPLTHVRVAYFEKETRELVGLELRRAVAVAAVGPGRIGGARQLLRRTARRVGAGRRPQRDVVPAGGVGARRAGGRRAASTAWRGTSSTGCCGCRACIRRTWCVTGAASVLPARSRQAPGCRRLTACSRARRAPMAWPAIAWARRCRPARWRFWRTRGCAGRATWGTCRGPVACWPNWKSCTAR